MVDLDGVLEARERFVEARERRERDAALVPATCAARERVAAIVGGDGLLVTLEVVERESELEPVLSHRGIERARLLVVRQRVGRAIEPQPQHAAEPEVIGRE